jgi:hypothetical protein
MTQHGLRSCGAPFRRDGIRSEASLDVAHQGRQPGQHHHGIKQRPRRPAVLRPPDKDITRSRTSLEGGNKKPRLATGLQWSPCRRFIAAVGLFARGHRLLWQPCIGPNMAAGCEAGRWKRYSRQPWAWGRFLA